MRQVDICVLTAGRFDLLADCLESLKALDGIEKCNVFVLDNGSPLPERKMFEALFTDPFITKTKRLSKNVGFGGGANAVISMGRAPLVLFVSDDVTLEPTALTSLLETMKSGVVSLSGLKLLFASGELRGKVQHVGHTMTVRGKIIHPFLTWSADNPRTCVSGTRYSVTGATFMVRRRAFEQVGGFDPVYGAGYFEDVELALNIRSRGGTIWCDCNAVGYHHVGATFQTRKEKFGEESPLSINEQIFVARNRSRMTWTDWEIR